MGKRGGGGHGREAVVSLLSGSVPDLELDHGTGQRYGVGEERRSDGGFLRTGGREGLKLQHKPLAVRCLAAVVAPGGPRRQLACTYYGT